MGPIIQTRSSSEPPLIHQHENLYIMRTLKESPKRDKIKPAKDPQLKQQIAKLVQRTRMEKPTTLPFFQQSKLSTKAFGAVRSFAANTNVGTVRKANEDRIAIILNVI